MTPDRMNESLMVIYNVSYDSLLKGIKEFLPNTQLIDSEQYKEIMVVPIVAILKSVFATFGDFGDASSSTNKIIGGFLDHFLSKNTKDAEERKKFAELIWKRFKEYSE